MPWKVASMASEKQKFIILYQSGRFTKTELCKAFGISRPTGDAILKRFEEEGWEALSERSKRHIDHPQKTAKDIEDAIVAERKKHSHWGGKKINALLKRDYDFGDEHIPSVTTVNNILKSKGLVQSRQRVRRHLEDRHPVYDPDHPNQIVSADFKGKFRMGNHEYCNPLTIADTKSRYLFAIQALERPDTECCIPIFDKVFREYGLPEYLHTDNGAPFGNANSLRRMTQFSVWIMDVAVTPVYSDPAHPEQNGRHERMHRDLKAEATRPPAANIRAQQKKFDNFLLEYNTVRPHEALEMKTPAEEYIKSNREYHGVIRAWDYDKDQRVKLVTVNGAVRWNADRLVMISTALSGRYVGFEEVGDGVWRIWYRHVALGYYSELAGRVFEIEDLEL
jgi:transposase InsO family protein